MPRTIHSVSVLLEDPEDWTKALVGDGEAFGRIFDCHHDRVLRHSKRLMTSLADADDVVAIAFLELWRNRSRVRLVDGSVLPWLLVTATNAGSNVNRGARRYRSLLARLPAADAVDDPMLEFETSDSTEALRGLSLSDRRVVTLCVLEGYSEREAAEILAVPTGTIKSRLSRAKRRLRVEMTSSSQNTLVEEVGQ